MVKFRFLADSVSLRDLRIFSTKILGDFWEDFFSLLIGVVKTASLEEESFSGGINVLSFDMMMKCCLFSTIDGIIKLTRNHDEIIIHFPARLPSSKLLILIRRKNKYQKIYVCRNK